MGLSTHVLDTMHGCPAAGMKVALHRRTPQGPELMRDIVLNADGRNPDGPLIATEALQKGLYQLVFAVGDYFAARGCELPDPPFLSDVTLDFGIADADSHYHVPLLCSPWSHSTYRGS